MLTLVRFSLSILAPFSPFSPSRSLSAHPPPFSSILIHHGKPISESNIIVQYIDEAWQNKHPPLLPSDPYLKAQARFWADFVDKKINDGVRRIWSTKGEELEKAKRELIEWLKVLEGQLGDKAYLMGERFGYADTAMVPFYCWLQV